MTYEPKVGDEVIVRGKVDHIDSRGVQFRVFGPKKQWVWLDHDVLEPVPDAGEAEMRGEVTGPWAVTLSEAMEKVEKRVEALAAAPSGFGVAEAIYKIEARVADLEASAKVRDVPATMVNLASRVQGLEVTIKTMMEDAREKDTRVAAELDGVLVRVGRLEEKLQSGSVRIGARLAALEDWQGVQQLNWPLPPSDKPRGHTRWAADADEIRDAQGRVLKSKTLDVDPQADWSTARSVATSTPEKEALQLVLEINRHLREQVSAAQRATEQVRSANHNLLADLQRAEARLDRIGSFMRGRERSLVKDEILRILEDPAHGAHAQAPE